LIALAIYFVAIVEGGMMQNTKTYLQLDVGFSGEQAAWFFTLLMLTSLVGRYLFGWFYDLLSVKGVSVCFIIIGMGALMALPVTGLFTAFIFCIVRGFGHGGVLVEIPVLAKHVFGERSMSRVISIYTGAYSLGMATGGWSFGYSYDYFGSYRVIFLVSIVLCLISASIVYRARPVFWQRYNHETEP